MATDPTDILGLGAGGAATGALGIWLIKSLVDRHFRKSDDTEKDVAKTLREILDRLTKIETHMTYMMDLRNELMRQHAEVAVLDGRFKLLRQDVNAVAGKVRALEARAPKAP